MTTDYNNGIIALQAASETIPNTRLAISHITVMSPTNAGIVEVQDTYGKTLCKVQVDNTYLPTVTVPLNRTVDGVQLAQQVTGAETLVYLKRG